MVKKFLRVGVASGEYQTLEVAKRNIHANDGNPAKTSLIFDENPFNDIISNSKNILDIGCGMGRMLENVLLNTKAKYFGVDPNSDMLKYFWEYNQKYLKYKDRIYITNDIYDLELQKQQFDVIISTFVFQHIGSRVPENTMNINDITQEISKNIHKNTLWFLVEHEKEEINWISKWLNDNNLKILYKERANKIYKYIDYDEDLTSPKHYIIIARKINE